MKANPFPAEQNSDSSRPTTCSPSFPDPPTTTSYWLFAFSICRSWSCPVSIGIVSPLETPQHHGRSRIPRFRNGADDGPLHGCRRLAGVDGSEERERRISSVVPEFLRQFDTLQFGTRPIEQALAEFPQARRKRSRVGRRRRLLACHRHDGGQHDQHWQ
jgi:hypothetical protein